MTPNKIVPFSCHQCGDRFELTEGGICSFCNNLFCRSHLAAGTKKGQPQNTCSDCINKLQKFIDFRRSPDPRKKSGNRKAT